MSTEQNSAFSTFTVSVSTTDQEHDAIAPPSPSQLVLPGMELTAEDALAMDPVTPHEEVLTEEPKAVEEAAFEPTDLNVDDVIEAVKTADVQQAGEIQPRDHEPENRQSAESAVAVEQPRHVEQVEPCEQTQHIELIAQAESVEPAEQPEQVSNTEPVSFDPKEIEAAPEVKAEEPASEPLVPADQLKAEPGFSQLDLHDDVLASVVQQGYDTPTEIQSRIIPHMLQGRDVLAQSQTGTGKTAAFALPILSLVEPGGQKPQVLVLAPTRELAMQVAAAFEKYGQNLKKLQVAAIYGGADYGPQIRQLRRGVDVVVGTPGRVIDHIKREKLDLSELRCLVLDEADEMLKMGFLEDVQFVLEHTPHDRQVALFSATLPPAIRGIAQHYLSDPARITVKTKTMTAESIRQRAIFTVGRDKLKVLQRILEAEETDGIIVFVKTKESTIQVAEDLARDGLSAVAINGDMPQKVRERTIRQFKKGRLDILVATDVAARGLDVDRVSHVFNYDLPHGSDTDSYVHRIGRTGRAGRTGEAIIFLTRSERRKLHNIERATRQPIEIVEPPTSDDINKMRVQRYKERISKTAEAADLTFFTELLQAHATETGLPMETVAAAVAQMALGRKSFFLKKDKPKKKFEGPDDRGERTSKFKGKRDREVRPPEAGMARYRIAIGRRDGVKPGNIVGAIANEADIDSKFIGHINIQQSFTTIDLPEDMPKETQKQLYHTRVVGRQMRLELESEYQSKPRGERPRRVGKPGGPKKFAGKKFSKGKSSSFSRDKKRKFKKSDRD